MVCPVCDGSGKLLATVCPLCDGLNEAADEDEGSKDLSSAMQKTITVRRMDGEVLLGSACRPHNMLISYLRDEVLEVCWQSKMDACEVVLLHGAHELADDEYLPGDEVVEILAVLKKLELSAEELAESFRKLNS